MAQTRTPHTATSPGRSLEAYAEDASPPRRPRRRTSCFDGTEVFGIELGRLSRALRLSASPLVHRRWRITGGDEPHHVDLSPDAPVACDCGDHTWREGHLPSPCKHILRARMAEGDEVVLRALGVLTVALEEYATNLEDAHRPRPLRLSRELKDHVAATLSRPLKTLAFQREETRDGLLIRVLVRGAGTPVATLVRTPAGIAVLPTPSVAPAARAA